MLEEIESIQVLNKAEGGPGMLAELSLDISCQHFITVAVIKRWRHRRWLRAAKLHLGWTDKPPTATADAAQGLRAGTEVDLHSHGQEKSTSSPHLCDSYTDS